MLDKLTKVPRNAQERPLVDVKIDSAEVVPNFADALLLISATAPGTSTLTVSVDDKTSEPVAKTFTVTAARDKFNDPPFLEPVPPKTVAKETLLEVPLRGVDLESDFLFYGNKVLGFGSGSSSGSGNPARVIGNNGYTGPLSLGVSIFDYDQTYRGAIDGPEAGNDDLKPVAIGVGDRAIDAKAVSFEATPGVALSGQTVATYTDADPRGLPAEFTAQINWGDGKPLTTGTILRNPGKPGAANYIVIGSHTYGDAGTFPVTVELTGTKGTKAIKRGMAVVSAGPVKALGTTLPVEGGEVTNRVVATFSDTVAGQPGDYLAQINWGDGRVSVGTVRRSGAGTFQVLGTHRYADAEMFMVTVRVRKTGAPDAIAWSSANVRGVTAPQQLPPFKIAHLIGQISPVQVTSGGTKAVRTTTGTGADAQTYLSIELIVLNAGDKVSQPGNLRFYLSADKTLNLADQTLPDPENPGQNYVNPADRLITIGGEAQGNLQAVAPGSGVRYVFDNAGSNDVRLRLPKGENGSSFNLLASFDYDDPIGDYLPLAREVVYGPFNGFVVKPTFLSVQEAAVGEAGSKTFTVKMDRRPTAPVTITLTVDKPAELLVAPLTLTFTPENFGTKQTITVTAKDDNLVDGTKSVRVTLAPAVSDDRQWDGIDPDDVSVTVLDKATTP